MIEDCLLGSAKRSLRLSTPTEQSSGANEFASVDRNGEAVFRKLRLTSSALRERPLLRLVRAFI